MFALRTALFWGPDQCCPALAARPGGAGRVFVSSSSIAVAALLKRKGCLQEEENGSFRQEHLTWVADCGTFFVRLRNCGCSARAAEGCGHLYRSSASSHH